MDAVVTRMLTFCVSVCYKNGSSGYTDVNILRIRLQEHTRGGNLKMMECTQRKQTILQWFWLHFDISGGGGCFFLKSCTALLPSLFWWYGREGGEGVG